MALHREVVDFVRLHLLDDECEAHRVGHVAVMQKELCVFLVAILIQMVDAVGVEVRCAALDAVDHVAFVQQQLGELGAGLAGDAGDECNLGCGHVLLGPASLRLSPGKTLALARVLKHFWLKTPANACVWLFGWALFAV